MKRLALLLFLASPAAAQFGGSSTGGINTIGTCGGSQCFTASAPSTQLTFTSSGGSGSATLRCPTSTALGSLTHILPTTSGTIAVGASSPLSLNTTTGVLSLGTVAIANGGTGQTAATAGFDALAPSSVAGDILVHNGSNSDRLAVGANNTVLTADANQANGVKWAAPVSGFGGDGSDGSCTWNGSAWSPSGCFFGCGNTSPCTVSSSAATSFGTSASAAAPGAIAVKPVAMKQFSSLSMSGAAFVVNFTSSGIKRLAILVQGNATLTTGTLNMAGQGEAGGAAGGNGGATACIGGNGGSTQVYGGGAGGAVTGAAGGSAAPVDATLFRYPWTAPWALSGGGGGGGCLGRTTAGGSGSGLVSSLWGSVNIAGAGGGGGGCVASGSSSGTPSAGGAGGGAIYIEVGGVATVASGFVLNASGAAAGAHSGTTNSSGGGGGGGGAIVVLYRSGTVSQTGWSVAGGAGASAIGSGCGAGGTGGGGLAVAKQVF